MKIFRISALAIGAAFILGATVLAIAYGTTFGTAVGLCAGIVMAASGLWFGRLPLAVRRAVVWSAAAGTAAFIAVLCIIIANDRDTVRYDEDCVLVLGCGVKGETVLPTLKARLDKCLEYSARNPLAVIVVSGGRGSRENITEAEAMRRYLEAAGVDPAQIVMETQARDTRENIANSRLAMDALLAADGSYSVACITSGYHLYRTRRIAAAHPGMDMRYLGSDVAWYLLPAACCREVLSVVKNWVTG